MVLLGEDTTKRSQVDEIQSRGRLVYAYFSHMDVSRWQGMKPEDLVGFEETLHQRLAVLGPQKLRDPQTLEALKAEFTEELPVLDSEIEGLGMSVYDLLLKIAEGQENFSLPPLSAHREDPEK